MTKLPKISKSIRLLFVPCFLIFACWIIGLFAYSDVQAQNIVPLTVAPARQQFSIDPGGSEYFSIKFINQAAIPLYGNLKVTDFVVKDSSGNPTLLDDVPLSTRFSGASWIKLPQDKASIAASGILNLQLKISVPNDARPGGRYVAISFEPTGSIPEYAGGTQEGTLGISQRIVGLIYIRVNGPITESAFIESFKAPSFVQFGPVPVSFGILNRGDYHITPTGQVTLTDWFGTTVDTQKLESKNVFPDAARTYENELGGKWMLGRYKVALTAAYGESGQVLTETGYVWTFPLVLFILVALGIIIIILLVMLLTNRLKKREKQLEEKLEGEIEELEKLKDSFRDKMPSMPPTPSSEGKSKK